MELGYSPFIRYYMYISYNRHNVQHRYNPVSTRPPAPWESENTGHLISVVRVVHVSGGGITMDNCRSPIATARPITKAGNSNCHNSATHESSTGNHRNEH